MSEMLERVARALCSGHIDPDQQVFAGNPYMVSTPVGLVCVPAPQSYPAWTLWLNDARAAIGALREPTPSMTEAGAYEIPSGFAEASDAVDVWQAMISKALEE